MKRIVIGPLVPGAAAAGAPASSAAPDFTVTNRVVLTRVDATAVALSPLIRVSCGRSTRDVATPAIHVPVYDTRAGAGWSLGAVVADVRKRKVVRFPHAIEGRRRSRAQVSGGDGSNEFNSDQEESSGRATFSRVRSDAGWTFRFRIDVVTGSVLFNLPSVRLRGSFGARG